MKTKIKASVSISQFIFSMLFALMIVMGRHVYFSMYQSMSLETIYVSDFHLIDLPFWVLLTILSYACFDLFCKFFEFFSSKIKIAENDKPGRRGAFILFISLLVIMFLCWIPYLMSFWPGGIYADTVDSINMALGKEKLNNHNPILYTLIWKFVFTITGAFKDKGDYPGLKLMTVMQTLLLASGLSGFMAYLYRKGLKRRLLLIISILFISFPLYPFYGISLWKDTIFSLCVFIFSIFIYDLFVQKDVVEKDSIKILELLGFTIGTLLIIFLRNNGKYVAFFYLAVILITLVIKRKKQLLIRFLLVSIIIVVFSEVIQGPLYNKYNLNLDTKKESMGIPIQQVAYVIANGGYISEKDLERLNEIMPIENWIALYNPVITDTIKFDPSFNDEYFEINSKKFMRIYRNIVFSNPVMALKAYMLQTMGFWDVTKSASTAYICNFHFGNAEYFMSDYFAYYLKYSFSELVEPKHYISSAIFVWIMLFTIFLCMKRRNINGILTILPTLGIWITIMLAVPVAFSFRYVYALFLCLPLYILICFDCYKNIQE